MQPSLTPYRVLVTGARVCTPADAALLADQLDRHTVGARVARRPVVIVVGDADGIDAAARQWAESHQGVEPDVHRADWKRHGKGAGGLRNQAMVDSGAEIALAFPAPDSVGTWDCLKRAAVTGIPGKVFPLATFIRDARATVQKSPSDPRRASDPLPGMPGTGDA